MAWRRLLDPRDVVIAAVTAAAALIALLTESSEPFGGARSPDLVGCLLMLVVGGAAGLRRVAPLVAGVASIAANTLATGLGYSTFVSGLIAASVIGVAAVHASRRGAVALGVCSAALAIVLLVVDADTWPVQVSDVVGDLAFAVVPVAIGDAFRSRHAVARDALERAARAEQLRDLELERTVTAERLRIAREVHDIVGHHISALAIQVGVGEQWLRAGNAAKAGAALNSARHLASKALAETQQSIQLIRDGSDPSPTVPTPSLSGLDALVDHARDSGVRVSVHREGNGAALPRMVDACAYRIVQEALTNVIRHARAQHVSVAVRRLDDRLELTILDDGRGATAEPGNGLTGMRERAALSGGTMVAGPADGGGWRVAATLPLHDHARA